MGKWPFPTSIHRLHPQESRNSHPLGLCLQTAVTSNEFIGRHTSYETPRVSSFIGKICLVLWALTATLSRAKSGQEKGTALPKHPQSEAVQKARQEIWEPAFFDASNEAVRTSGVWLQADEKKGNLGNLKITAEFRVEQCLCAGKRERKGCQCRGCAQAAPYPA